MMGKTPITAWGRTALGLILAIIAGCSKENPYPPSASDVDASETAVRKILIVHSYHPEYEWVAAINRGLQMAILPSDARVETCYMDTKRFPDASMMEKNGQEAMKLVEEWQPDVVIAVDDDAQRYVGSQLAGRQHPAVVFCGVNSDPAAYGYPAVNVTGVLERLHFNESLAFLKRLCPKARRIVLLTDHSTTSFGVIDYIKSLPHGALEVVDYVTPVTFAQWQEAVQRYSKEVDAIAVYVYHTVKPDEQSEQSMPPREVMAWTVENSSVPLLGFLVFSVDDGSLCGVLESGVEQGQLAGELAMEILNGKKPADLPFITGTRGQTMVNMNIAAKLGIDIDAETRKQIDVIAGQP